MSFLWGKFWQLGGTLCVGVFIGWWLHPNTLLRPASPLPHAQAAAQTILKPEVKPATVTLPPLALPPIPTPTRSAPHPSPPDFFALLNSGHINSAINLIKHWPDPRQQHARTAIRHTASVLINAHHADVAFALLTPYQQQWPQDIDARRLLAQSMLDLGRFQPAIALLTATMELTANQPLLHTLHRLLDLAIARYDISLRQRDQRNRLLDFYRQLGANDGSNVHYQLKQAELLVEMGQLTEASALLQPLLFGQQATTDTARQLQHKIKQQLAQAFTNTIALTRLHNHFLVPLQLAGRTLMLLLDTGASLTLVPTSITTAFPTSDKRGRVTLATANGTITVPTLLVPQLQLGGQTLYNISVALTDNMGIVGADGLLGMDILKRFHFVIDQENATLRLTPRASG